MYKQDSPNSIQIEPTEGCNLRCSFCGLNGIRDADHDFKYMTEETAQTIAIGIAEAGWAPRVEFAMHGEPTTNPALLQLIALFRAALPRAYLLLETNGSNLVHNAPASLLALFDAGLNTLAVDEYVGVSWAQRLRATLGDAAVVLGQQKIDHHEYPASIHGNPHRRNSRKRLVFIAPINTATRGTHCALVNHCGAAAPLDDSMAGQRCARPFREMSFRYDGSVALCCNDWRGEYVVGNVHTNSVLGLWHHVRMYAARHYLYHGQRTFTPCRGCNARSYRVGLLPDKVGKLTLSLPSEENAKKVLEALADGPLAKPVLRAWEK
jgi:hypothetical protein